MADFGRVMETTEAPKYKPKRVLGSGVFGKRNF